MSQILDSLEKERVKWNNSSYVPTGTQLNHLYKFLQLYKDNTAIERSKSTVARWKTAKKKLKDINKIHSGLFVLYGCSHNNIDSLKNVLLPVIERWWHGVNHPRSLLEWAEAFCKTEGIEYSNPHAVLDGGAENLGSEGGSMPGNRNLVSESTRPEITLSSFSPSDTVKVQQTTLAHGNVIVNAPLEGVSKVFPEYWCRAIRRVREGASWKAAITMQFPEFALVDCVMMLEVNANEVEHLVKSLFGIEMESVGGVRHLLMGQGVRLTSNTANPEFTLKGVPDQRVIEEFGSDVYSALKAGAMYEQELHVRKRPVTECVSMIFTSRSDEGAFINLGLDLKGGIAIKDKLYS
ncbi:hypothetical protein EIK77_003988 [Talaromyces pinophilus]|nr:hypothetical protein EIK77_003988 [Talaromyces pinophilus]